METNTTLYLLQWKNITILFIPDGINSMEYQSVPKTTSPKP
jgi:hypothetical protein